MAGLEGHAASVLSSIAEEEKLLNAFREKGRTFGASLLKPVDKARNSRSISFPAECLSPMTRK